MLTLYHNGTGVVLTWPCLLALLAGYALIVAAWRMRVSVGAVARPAKQIPVRVRRERVLVSAPTGGAPAAHENGETVK